MTAFRITRAIALPAAVCWLRVTDWPSHAARVPLTSVTVPTPAPVGVGTVFVARSAIGRWGFDDPMEVVRWEPPAGGRAGVCRLEKRGRVILGWAEIEVLPASPHAGPEPRTGQETWQKTRPDTETRQKTRPDRETGPETGPETETRPETETGPERGPQSGTGPQTRTDPGVGPDVGEGSVVVWTEELRIRPLPRLLDPLVTLVGRAVFGRALDGILTGGPSC